MKKMSRTYSAGRISVGTARAVLGALVLLVLLHAPTYGPSPAAENDSSVVFGVR